MFQKFQHHSIMSIAFEIEPRADKDYGDGVKEKNKYVYREAERGRGGGGGWEGGNISHETVNAVLEVFPAWYGRNRLSFWNVFKAKLPGEAWAILFLCNL